MTRRRTITWWPSRLTMPIGNGTKVELTQSNLIGGVTQADRDSRADFEKNWSTVLKGLKDEVES